MASEGFARSGRGGAGNFQSKEEERKIIQSLPTTNPRRDAEHASTASAPYARSGRGGAGNVYTPSADAPQEELGTAPVTQSNVRSGRGGAGNIFDDEQQRRAGLERQETRRQQEGARVSEQARSQVDAGLRAPEKTYAGLRRAQHDEAGDLV